MDGGALTVAMNGLEHLHRPRLGGVVLVLHLAQLFSYSLAVAVESDINET